MTTKRSITPLGFLCAVVLGVVALPAVLLASPAASAPSVTTVLTTTTTTVPLGPAAAVSVEGSWTMPPPVVVEQTQSGNNRYTRSLGTTTLSGGLMGTATLDLRITQNLVSGAYHGTVASTFTGTATGVGSGSFDRRLTAHGSARDPLFELARWNNRIVSGTGDFTGIRGALEFTGTFDQSGGSGTYRGHLVLPASTEIG